MNTDVAESGINWASLWSVLLSSVIQMQESVRSIDEMMGHSGDKGN